MSTIDYFFSCFVGIDKNNPPEIQNIEATDFSVDITVGNASLTQQGLQTLRGYFGDVPLSFSQLDGQHGVKLSISRVKTPDQSYSVLSILKYIQANQKKGLFMGVGDFGPLFLSFNDLTHAQVYGASGFGKSSFFRFMMSQTLAFQPDVMNYIIDPKQIDYKAFENHPRVGRIATNRDEWFSLLGNLIVEMGVREHIYTEAFSTPPTSLQEYRQFKEEHRRSDLPEFPRILLWIDEAHMINEYQSDDIGNHVSLLLKKGRAFGIHVLATTQRIADMPTSIKSQASTIMLFYMHDSMGLSGISLEDYHKHMTAIRGRLSYFNPIQSKFHSCQVPFMTSNEALGMSYGFGSSSGFPNRGFYRLRLSSKLTNEARLPVYLCRGQNLKSIAKMTALEAEESLRTRAPYRFVYSDVYEVYPESSSQSGPTEKTKKDDLPSADELLKEFGLILEANRPKDKNESAIASPGQPVKTTTAEKLSTPAPTPAPAPTPDRVLDMESVNRSKNTPEMDSLVQSFQTQFKTSHIDFSWCNRDLSGNQGLITTYRKFRGQIESEERPVTYEQLALDPVTQGRLDRFLSEVKQNASLHRKSPLLIISGLEGMGKRTLAKAIAMKLDLPSRKSRPEDLISFDHIRDEISSLLKEAQPDDTSTPKASADHHSEVIFFNDLNAVLSFYRNCRANQIPVLINEWKTGLEGAYNKVSKDFMSLNDPHTAVELSAETYKPEEVLEKLIRTLLGKYQFADKLEKFPIKPFVSSGVPLIPLYLDALIERAQKRALLGSKVFNWEFLNDLLDAYKIKETQTSTGVTVVIPQKSMGDMVAREETLSDLHDVIHKSQNLDKPRPVFAQRLRKGDRMVALFSGPPGTGKSMAAEIVAKEAQKELWICDFGKMQNAYVGETEKILTEIFYRAQTSKAVLLLDEADAFLTNRSGDLPSYMLKWINHLLTLIENYSGILILTTNFPENMDPAFSRRIDVKARFFEPNREQLKILISKMLEPDAPLDPALDLDKATEGITLSGGLIRNAIERLILKMERLNISQVNTEILRSALIETQEENSSMLEKEKRIGFA